MSKRTLKNFVTTTLKRLGRKGTHGSSEKGKDDPHFKVEPLNLRVVNDFSQAFNLKCIDYDKYQGILVCGTKDGRIYLFGKPDCELIMSLQPADIQIEKMFLPANTGLIVGYGSVGEVPYLFFWKNLKQLYQVRLKKPLSCVLEKRDHLLLVFADQRNLIRFFDHKRKELCEFLVTVPEKISSLSCKKNVLLVGCDSGCIYSYDLAFTEEDKNVGVAEGSDGKATLATGFVAKFTPKGQHGKVCSMKLLKNDSVHFLAVFNDGLAVVFENPKVLKPLMKIAFFKSLIERENVEISAVCVSGINKMCIGLKRKKNEKKSEKKEEKKSEKEKKEEGAEKAKPATFFGIYSLEFPGKKIRSCKLARKYCENLEIDALCPLTPIDEKDEHTVAIITKKGNLKYLNLHNGLFLNTGNSGEEEISSCQVIDAPKNIMPCFKPLPIPKDTMLPTGGAPPRVNPSKSSDLCVLRSHDSSLKLYAVNSFVGRKTLLYNLFSRNLKKQELVGFSFWSSELIVLSESVGELSYIDIHTGKVSRLSFEIPKEFQEEMEKEKPQVVLFHTCAFFNKILYVFSNFSFLIYDLLSSSATHFRNTIIQKHGQEKKESQPISIVEAAAAMSVSKDSLNIIAMDSTGHCHHFDLNGTLFESFKVFKKDNQVSFLETVSKYGKKTISPPLKKHPPHILKQLVSDSRTSARLSHVIYANHINEMVKPYDLNTMKYCIEVRLENQEEGYQIFDGSFEVTLYENDPEADAIVKIFFNSQNVKIGYFLNKSKKWAEKKTPPVKEKKEPAKEKEGEPEKKDEPEKPPKKTPEKPKKKTGKWVVEECDKISIESNITSAKVLYFCFHPHGLFEVFSERKVVLYKLECKKKTPFKGLLFKNCKVDVDDIPRHVASNYSSKEDYVVNYFKDVVVHMTNDLHALGKGASVYVDFLHRYIHPMRYIVCSSSSKVKVFRYKKKKKTFRKRAHKKFKSGVASCSFSKREDLPLLAISTWKSQSLVVLSFPELDVLSEASFENLRIPPASSLSFTGDGKRLIACGPYCFADISLLKKGETIEIAAPKFFNPKVVKRPRERATFGSIIGSIFGSKPDKFIDGFTSTKYEKISEKEKTAELMEVLDILKDREDSIRKKLEEVFQKSSLPEQKKKQMMDDVLSMTRKEKQSRLIGETGRDVKISKEDKIFGKAVGDMDDTMNAVSMAYQKMLQRLVHLREVVEKTEKLRDAAEQFAKTTSKY